MVELAYWISQRRFDEYLAAAHYDSEDARVLYEWNVSVSGAFFELICHVEVALRNAVDGILSQLEVASSARVEEARGWWFASATFLRESELVFSRTASRHLVDRTKPASRDRMLASMTFGIWDAMFGRSYEQLFRKHLVHAFPYRNAGFTRAIVKQNVLVLKNLRNRIAHHQPIFDRPLDEYFTQAMDLLRWISPDLADWVQAQSRIPDLLAQRPVGTESMARVDHDSG